MQSARGRNPMAPYAPLVAPAPTKTGGLPRYVCESSSSNHSQSATSGEGASIVVASPAPLLPRHLTSRARSYRDGTGP